VEIVLTLLPARAAPLDVSVRAEPGTPLRAVADDLRALAGRPGAEIYAGSTLLAGSALLGGPGLRDGDVLGIGRPDRRDVLDADGVLELRVTGGPDAGGVYGLPRGELIVGRSPEADVSVADPDVSRRHLAVTVSAAGVRVRDLGSTNGTFLDGVRVGPEPVPLPPDRPVRLGETTLVLAVPSAPPAPLRPDGAGGLEVHRSPRLRPPPIDEEIELPTPPPAGDPPAVPLLAGAVPLALGVVTAVVLHSVQFLVVSVLSSVVLLTGGLVQRRRARVRQESETAEYEHAVSVVEGRLAAAVAEDVRRRRADSPDPAVIDRLARGVRTGLWLRRATDEDALLLRLGTADLPSGVRRRAPREPTTPATAPAVPVTVALDRVGVLGLAGPRGPVEGLARWLVVQTAVLRGPADLSVVLLCEDAAADRWEWARWLPQLRPRSGPLRVGLTATQREERLDELVRELDDRLGRRLAGAVAWTGPQVVVVVEVLEGRAAAPALDRLLAEGPLVGIVAVCLCPSVRLLPAGCGAVAELAGELGTRLRLRVGGEPEVENVLVDAVRARWAERVARALAPLRDLGDSLVSGPPTSLRLLDVLGLEPPSGPAVLDRWAQSGRTTLAPIGASADGVYTLDLRRDGPHALIAGTTGAGKSELLQTIIASLATANRPDALTFILIDYKGGAAFNDCTHLPHTVGLVTDLDGHLTERALHSLNAELKRREHLLATAGAKDIDDYWHTHPGHDPLPRTILIIDEFASLVEELPDFVTGLIGIAMRGRSLGVHLILATQRPTGVVSPAIRANTNLRIALRVTDTTESTDIIDTPHAAHIPKTTPGRAYARTGFSALTAFQAARVGGRRPGAVQGPPPALATPVGWRQLGAPIERPAPVEDEAGMETDLQVLVGAIRAAATRAGLGTYRSPWLPALPEELALDALPEPAEQPALGDPAGKVRQVPFGIEDLPDEQAQVPLVLDLERGSHLIVSGAPRSGRSTVLRTLAGSLARHTTCRDVHLYALDCGNAAMRPLADLPHCGAVVTRDQVDRVDRLLTMLINEISRRQVLLAQHGYGSLAEQRAAAEPDERLPYLVFLLDRWEGFMATFDDLDAGRLTQNVLRILREGPGVGLRAVVAGDRSTLMGRLPTTVEDKLVMRMGDRNDYGLAGLSARRMPDVMPAGRAFRNDTMIETQFALLDPDPSGPAQVAALAAIARSARERDSAVPRRHRPARVDLLPARITVREALALAADPASGGWRRPASALWALVGVGGDELAPIGVDLDEDGPGFVVGGPPRSGRSTALVTMADSLLDAGCELVVVTPRQSPLRGFAGRPGVLGVLSGIAVAERDVLALLDQALGPAVVMVDDGELLVDAPSASAFETVLREGRDAQRALVVGGTTGEMINGYRGYVVEARKTKSGVLLCPEHPLEGDLLGIRPPRSAVGPAPKGRGLLVTRGTFVPVQVPLPPG
jgi:S-DNA-T family DNA segregation ATPase FtsK/SpoIIIE